MTPEERRKANAASAGPYASPRPIPDQRVYQGWLGRAVSSLAPTTEADPVAILASFAAEFSTMVGPEPHVMIHDDAHPLLIWPLILGRTGNGRKGMSYGVTKKVMRRADVDFYANCVTSGLSSGEGLISAVADGDDEDAPGGKVLFVVETEYAVTMARAGREGNTLGGVLRQAWEGDTLRAMTRAMMRATRPHVGILAHITPDEFRLRVKTAEMAGGTYNRFLPIYSERLREIPLGDGAARELIATLGVEMAERVKRAKDVRAVGLTPDAADYWSTVVYPVLSASPAADGVTAQFTARATAYCRRLAAVYALADGAAIVGREHLEAAYHLMHYSRATAAYVFGATSTGDPRLDKVLAALMSAGEAGLTRTQISSDVFKKHITTPLLDEVLAKLTALPDVEREQHRTGGRPTERWTYRAEKAEEAEKALPPAQTLSAPAAEKVRNKARSAEAADFLRTFSAAGADNKAAGEEAYSAYSAFSAPHEVPDGEPYEV